MRIPPQALDIEMAVLGAILTYKDSFYKVSDILKSDMFYKTEHRIIYESFHDLIAKQSEIDILTVSEQLKENRKLDAIGGIIYLNKISDSVVSSLHLDLHARILVEKSMKREIIKLSSELENMAFDESNDISDVLEHAENKIMNVSNAMITNEASHVKQSLVQSVKEIEAASKNSNKLLGYSSGLATLDRITSGWQNSDLLIMAARPSMGKTAFALKFAKELASLNIPVAFFSLEMSKTQLCHRLLSSDIDISPMKLRTGNFGNDKWVDIETSLGKLSNLDLYIDDKASLSILDVKARARRYIMKYGIKMIIIDYIQLMKGDKFGNREQEVSSISRGLKILAKDLNVPVIALSQLSRGVESRVDKKPLLSDLRESGAIEQDADIVMFLYRAEKYGITEDDNGESTIGRTELIISKNRNGAVGSVTVENNESLTKINDLRNNYNVDSYIEPFF